jgi:hypothetical protein
MLGRPDPQSGRPRRPVAAPPAHAHRRLDVFKNIRQIKRLWAEQFGDRCGSLRRRAAAAAGATMRPKGGLAGRLGAVIRDIAAQKIAT